MNIFGLQVQSAAGDDDAFDMFGGDDDVPPSTTAGVTAGNSEAQVEKPSTTLLELPGYVYDANSGYCLFLHLYFGLH